MRVLGRRKPTFASVTTKPCTCNWARDISAEPDTSVRFDDVTNEYHFITPQGGTLVIYHCPFCGGAMPASKRGELFAYIPGAEVARLEALTRDLTSVEEATRVLGPPDEEMARGLIVRQPAKRGRPPHVVSHPVMVFKKLSDTADIHLTNYGPEGIRFTFQGKYIGKGRGRRTTG